MPRSAHLFAIALTCVAMLAGAAENRFDGAWDTILSCENTSGAKGYAFKFDSSVKNSVLHGEKGTKGKPGWLQLDGKIGADGAANLFVDGLVGASEAAIGHLAEGSKYGYHVDAKFGDDSG